MGRKFWIQDVIKREGRVRKYLKRKYGDKAFKKDGTIKLSYLNKAIRELGHTTKGSVKHSLKMALILARRLIKMKRKK